MYSSLLVTSTYGECQVLCEFSVDLGFVYAHYVYMMAFAKQFFNQIYRPYVMTYR